VAWKYDTGEKGGIEANPIIVGKVLYATTPRRSVVALDAATGKLIWKFDFGLPGFVLTRGVSYWTDGQQSRILAGARHYLLCARCKYRQGDSQLWGERQNRLT